MFFGSILWQIVALSVLREVWVPSSFLTVRTKPFESVVLLNLMGTDVSNPWETHHPRPFLSVTLVLLVQTRSAGIAMTRTGLNHYLEIVCIF